jgi:hypothetical protein
MPYGMGYPIPHLWTWMTAAETAGRTVDTLSTPHAEDARRNQKMDRVSTNRCPAYRTAGSFCFGAAFGARNASRTIELRMRAATSPVAT